MGEQVERLDQQEREILVKVLKDSSYNRTLAAQRLGLSLRQIRYRIARLKIDALWRDGNPAPGLRRVVDEVLQTFLHASASDPV